MSESNQGEKYSMPKSDKKSSNAMLYVVGVGMVCTAALLSVLGGKAAISSINREANAAVAATQQQIESDAAQKHAEELAEVQAVADAAEEALAQEQARWTSDQIEWMKDNEITYGEDGLPLDTAGRVQDDPTTNRDEVTTYEEMQEAERKAEEEKRKEAEEAKKAAEAETETEPETEAPWYEGNSYVELKDGEPVHYVRRGETLSEIAVMTGFTVSELADFNHISNPGLIETGQCIYFPVDGPGTGDKAADTKNVGRG